MVGRGGRFGVVAWRRLLAGDGGGGLGGPLGAGPGFVAPGKEDEEEFAEDVRGGDVEVVFQGGDGDVAVQLVISKSEDVEKNRRGRVGEYVRTLASMYSAPPLIACWPIWKPICAVWSLTTPPKLKLGAN